MHEEPTTRRSSHIGLGHRQCLLAVLIAIVNLFVWSVPTRSADAQQSRTGPQRQIEVTGDRLSGIVLPIEPIAGDIQLSALKAWTWTVDDTTRIILEGDVMISVGNFEVDANQASVWLNRIPSSNGLINQVALFLDDVGNPSNRAGIGVAGKDILVTGSARGSVTMNVALIDEFGRPPQAFNRKAEARLAEHLRGILTGQPLLAAVPQYERPDSATPRFVPVPGGTVPDVQSNKDDPLYVSLPDDETELPPMFVPTGRIRFSAEAIDIETLPEENVVLCTGGMMVQYHAIESQRDWSRLTMTAERAVIFTQAGPLEELASQELTAEQIFGIYLEGDVAVMADDGTYTVRAPRAYYDFRTGQAVMVKSVLRTYMRGDNVPVYARAEELRQVAANQWQAQTVRVSTSAFAVPHISLGSESMTITQRPRSSDPTRDETWIESGGNTLRMGDVPIGYLPRFEGNTDAPPLRTISFSDQKGQGFGVQTAWDLYALMGIAPPTGVTADLKAEYYLERGPGVGLVLDYDVAGGEGAIDVFGLLDEGGTDRTQSGRNVDVESGLRGVALWEHRMNLGGDWSFQGQIASISDPTYVSAWREDDFDNRRQFESSAYVKWQRDNKAFTALTSAALDDFISNSYLLASRGYQVEKLPELAYYTMGNSIFDDTIIYSSETRVTRARLVFDERTPSELGIPGDAYGIDDDDEIDQFFRTQGYSSQSVIRGDTRHEISMPHQAGIFKVVPFAVARVTWYDEEFTDYSAEAESTRLYGAAGIRIATQMQRIYDDFESNLFDVHRLRHVIEPSATLWYGHSDVSQRDLPVYDEAVESLSDGWAVRLGLLQRWQTQRGGPGNWRSVDVFRLRTDIVFDEAGDAERESPTSQFVDYRPEYSQPGDHVFVEGLWNVSDSFAIVGQGTYDLEESLIARGSIGFEVLHNPLMSTFVEYRMIDASDNELLGVRMRYQITPLYDIYLRPQWDFKREEFRSLRISLNRQFPDFNLRIDFSRDEIRDENRVSASVDVLQF